MCPGAMQCITDLLPGKALEAIIRLAVKEVQVSPVACALAQVPQWGENPC